MAAGSIGLLVAIAVTGLALSQTACVQRSKLSVSGADILALGGRGEAADGSRLQLPADGEVVTRLRFRSVHRWRVDVSARVQPAADGAWPQIRVRFPGQFPRTFVVDNLRPIAFDAVSEPGYADLAIALLNPGEEGRGPVVQLERIDVTPVE